MPTTTPSVANPSTLLEAVCDEVGYRALASSLYTGPCPSCRRGIVLAWDWRHCQPRDSFRCLDCGTRGNLYRLSKLHRQRGVLMRAYRAVAA